MKVISLLPFALALLASGTATAASLMVRPTTVVLEGSAAAATFTVSNSGDAPITAQIRVFGWDQNANEDSLTPTQALVASPPMTTIPPGQSQTVRLVRIDRALPTREEHYRLLVDEIVDAAADASSGVAIQLRYSVPVFVMPNARDVANMTMTANVLTDALQLEAQNMGGSHAQISNISLAYSDGSSVVVEAGLVGYVLPSKSRQWRFEVPATTLAKGNPQSVRAVVNGEELLISL
jgi:fimbrial chaperone protein